MPLSRKKIEGEYTAAIHGRGAGLVAGTGKARFAAYAPASVSEELLETSFGCGDPVAFSRIEPGQTVVDLGCGAGLDLILAAQRVGPTGRVIGVDASEAMIERARDNAQRSRFTNIDIRHGAIESLPVADASVDWVISNCVINLSSDKERVFREIARVLRPGGRMLVSDIVAEGLPRWIRRTGLLVAACVAGAITEKRYLEGLETAGLSGATILARRYYEASQFAAVVVDMLPRWMRRIRCCGRQPAMALFTRIARPFAGRLWSVRVSAVLPARME